MKKFKLMLVALLFQLMLVGGAQAASNPLSVHVLNLQDGLPSPGVTVTIEKEKNGVWIMLGKGITNEQGRITALFPKNEVLSKGNYRVTFKTGEWFAQQKIASFFPEIPIIFHADGSVPHYHIPLLLSPYGYSSYRGN